MKDCWWDVKNQNKQTKPIVQMLEGLLLLVYQRQPFQKQSLLSMLNEPGLNFLAVSVAEATILSLTLSETPKAGFVESRSMLMHL